MPLTWDELSRIQSPKEFSLQTVPAKLTKDGDAWDGMEAYAVNLHTERTPVGKASKLVPSGKRKTPEQLQSYQAKRDFTKTPEPAGYVQPGKGNGFVVHRHHASHIHYDLRLEKEGVLRSWAVPKGLPPSPGIKRLAVQTEDHPLEYLNFEGTIPKGEYGGGDMWVFMQGRYEITKEKKDGSFYFKLISKVHTGEYRMFSIKGKDWLLERVDENQKVRLNNPPDFMLAESVKARSEIQKKAILKSVFEDQKFEFEVKWDGIRAMVIVNEGIVKILSRNHRDITKQFPELCDAQALRAVCGIFDCEIVSLDSSGRPEFKRVINRLMASGEATIKKQSTTHPVCCYIFDCLFLDGRSILNDPLVRRRIWIKDIVKADSRYRVSEMEKDGKALFKAAGEHQLEGIVAKRMDGVYQPGKRSEAWIKIKVQDTADCVIIGFTPGKGNRTDYFGGLHIAELTETGIQYRGRVGSGFDDKLMKEITQLLQKSIPVKKPVEGKVMEEKNTVWIEPTLWAEIRYSSITRDKMFREPVFVRLRPDK
jgi:DNA ligase D-like protein (predicted ligase)/DNA ligase D-like protein (predicted 3'-phosphoesterase)